MRSNWRRDLIPDGVHPFWDFFLEGKHPPRLRFLAYLHWSLGGWTPVAKRLGIVLRTMYRWIKEDRAAQ